MGDTVHFIRYVPLVAGKGARVIVECQKELVGLVRSVKGVDAVFEKGGELPVFDVWCPLLSLPLLFATTLKTVPANIPYLFAQEELKETWRQKVIGDQPGFKVGLVWAGNPKYRHDRIRSCPLELFAGLEEMKGIQLYSLQKGGAEGDAKSRLQEMGIIDYMDEVNNFADTAALIENLDLVISVDTAVLHVAGAIGKRAWALLPYAPDWRWMLNRTDSPWYPTMKLFRQPKFGDWESVLKEVTQALRKEISSKLL
jgi:ADP-heptose:LPS heptosyltransferase